MWKEKWTVITQQDFKCGKCQFQKKINIYIYVYMYIYISKTCEAVNNLCLMIFAELHGLPIKKTDLSKTSRRFLIREKRKWTNSNQQEIEDSLPHVFFLVVLSLGTREFDQNRATGGVWTNATEVLLDFFREERGEFLSGNIEVPRDSYNMAMDQYLLIPFLVGWTSMYQLFWCSPGVPGFWPTAI